MDIIKDDYKNKKEYQSLNRIWKLLPSDSKKQAFDDFKIINDFIKYQYSVINREIPPDYPPPDEFRYLDELSAPTRELIRALVKDGDKNIYHSVMAVIGSHIGQFQTVEQLWNYYSRKYGAKRSYIFTYETEIKEVMELCLRRMDEKEINPL